MIEQLLNTTAPTADLVLAQRYAPILQFDAAEPFSPIVAGYTIFHKDAPSPSFPRGIELQEAGKPVAATAIEYAIWWDWDIGHLYELEHVWVFIDADGEIVRGEASWHGRFHDMAVDGKLPLTEERLTLFSEPGKHALAPTVDWLLERVDQTRIFCMEQAGVDGLIVTDAFNGRFTTTPHINQLAKAYLQQYAFTPTMQFTQQFTELDQKIVPWSALDKWIPARINWWKSELVAQNNSVAENG